MRNPGEAPAWKVLQGATLLWRQWDGEYIVYNSASGDTHLLNPIAAAALRCLEQSPADVVHLTEWVVSEQGLEPEPELRQHLEKLLTQFEELGLIEVVIE
jgi:PqqD family protein of HPr-rel-A system